MHSAEYSVAANMDTSSTVTEPCPTLCKATTVIRHGMTSPNANTVISSFTKYWRHVEIQTNRINGFLRYLVAVNQAQWIALVETHLISNKENEEVSVPKHFLLQRNRRKRSNGGVALYRRHFFSLLHDRFSLFYSPLLFFSCILYPSKISTKRYPLQIVTHYTADTLP